MQLVTDTVADLTPTQLAELDVHFIPLTLTLDGKTYRSGIDLNSAEFYSLLEKKESFATTSQPSAGEFAELYRRLAAKDPDILSIHISLGLSGTLNAARAGASMAPEANVTFFDSKTLSSPLGWMVQAAAHAIRQNWPLENIIARLEQMQKRTQGLFTLKTLKYLIHGGRISHLKGLIASMLNVKPIIGPEKIHGAYTSFGQEITLKRALHRIPEILASMFTEGQDLRVQILHGDNPEGVEVLQEVIAQRFNCRFDPVCVLSPVLGAHTGPSIVGLGAGDPEVFSGLF